MAMDEPAIHDAAALRLRTDEPLLWLDGAGHETRGDRSYFHDSRQRPDSPHVVLQLTLAGEGFFADARGRTLLPAGKAWLGVIPGDFDYGYSASPRAYELVFVSLRGEASFQWSRRIVEQFGNVLDVGRHGETAAHMLAIAHGLENRSLPDRYLMSARLYELLMTLLSALNRSRVNTVPRIAEALGLVHARAADRSFGVAALAAALDVSREHLTRQFRAAMGVSPSDYLMQHRLRLAVRTMRSGSDKLESIARRSGFSGANYFCRVFRLHMGLTPAEYRSRPWMAEP